MSMRPPRSRPLSRSSKSVRSVLCGALCAAVFAAVFAGAAVFENRSARASIVMALDLPDLVQQADHIALVDVLSQHADWDSKHQRILSTIELKVVERWKGDGAAAAAGGTSDRITV